MTTAQERIVYLEQVIELIAESVLVSVTVLKDGQQIIWGCGICMGEYQHADRPDGKGVYAHKGWCPRR